MESPVNAALPNNSIIMATHGSLRVPYFRGLSGSNKSHVGQLIGPQGNDVTSSNLDPFIVSLGRNYEPGTIYVRGYRSLLEGEVGIYTYRTPDEMGNTIDVNFGIYTSTASRFYC